MVLPLVAAAVVGAVEAAEAAEIVAGLARLGFAAEEINESTVRVDVRSSFIATLFYDTEAKVLTVEMDVGSSYEYPGISRETFEAFASADSPGEFYNCNVKLGHEGRECHGRTGSVRGVDHIINGGASIFKAANSIFGKAV